MLSKKILVVVDSIDVNDSSGSKANVALIQNLVAIGCNLKVLHYTLKEIQLEAINCVQVKEQKFSINYLLSRSQRIFTRITKININPFLEGLFGFSFTFFNDVKSIENAIKKEQSFQPDLVLTLSKGASFRSHYAMLHVPELHAVWMAYVHDPYPFHYYPRPYNWVEAGYKKKEQFFRNVSEKAAYSAFPSQFLKEWMGSYFPHFLKTGVVIPHQNSELLVDSFELPNYFNKNKFTVLHAGNLMKQRSPKGLIEGFKLFLKEVPLAKDNAQLILVGNASYHKELLIQYKEEVSELFVKTENEKFECVYLMQQAASVNVILESKSEISPFLPGKFPHCVAANKPILVLAPYYSETRRLLGEEYPYITEVDNVDEIANKLELLYVVWKEDPTKLQLNRPDLEVYLSKEYLKEIISYIN